MSRKIVVALGGNAILSENPTAEAQKVAVEQTVDQLIQFIKNGDQLIITHGNGPQVGNLLLQHHAAHSGKNPAFPLDSLVAMTEGSIGYWLQNAFQNALNKENITKSAATIVTQVIVDHHDPAFDNPTKPIGPFYTEEEAKKEMEKSTARFVEDAGRGWRKVVPSPLPIAIKEIETIKRLTEAGQIVIACGGGGIPVIEKEGNLIGVEAVIDKDFASRQLATDLDADLFIILTGVEYVYINYNQTNQEKLEAVTVEELVKYKAQNQFAAGSMLPKINAAIEFVQANPKKQAMITSLENIGQLIEGSAGTIIRN